MGDPNGQHSSGFMLMASTDDSSSSEQSTLIATEIDAEIDEQKRKSYERLQSGKYQITNMNNTLRCPFCPNKKKQEYADINLLQHAFGVGHGSVKRTSKQKGKHLALAMFIENCITNGLDQTQWPQQSTNKMDDPEELYCWPWTGIIVNVQNSAGFEHLSTFLSKYKPCRVEFLSSEEGVVEFEGSWVGFRNAVEFQRVFEGDGHGKRGWSEQKSDHGLGVYGWLAREDDYGSRGLVGEYLRRKRRLTSLMDVVREETQGIKRLRGNLDCGCDGELEKGNQELVKGERKRRRLEHDFTESEENSEGKQLDMKLGEVKEKLKMLRQLVYDDTTKEEIKEIIEELEEKLDDFGSLSRAFLSEGSRKNDSEIQLAREALIQGFENHSSISQADVGIKRMGQVEEGGFLSSCEEKLKADEAYLKAVELSSYWQEKLSDPLWYPFKILEIDGRLEERVDEEDEQLKELKAEWGEGAQRAVVAALDELKEYNARSAKCLISELWNFKEGRKASLKEGVDQLFNDVKVMKGAL